MTTPQEREQEIRERLEHWLNSGAWSWETPHLAKPTDVEYLLSRIQQLEQALEYYANLPGDDADDDWAFHYIALGLYDRARAALSTMPTGEVQ